MRILLGTAFRPNGLIRPGLNSPRPKLPRPETLSMPRRHLLPALLVLAGAVGCNSGQPPLAPPKPAEIVVSPAFVREVTDFEEFQGKTDASQAIDVRPRVTGKLVA